jgi:hypothetical protein
MWSTSGQDDGVSSRRAAAGSSLASRLLFSSSSLTFILNISFLSGALAGGGAADGDLLSSTLDN